MMIQCPACKAQAKLPDSKEGAKVRCPECSRVYVARARGRGQAKSVDPTRYVIFGGAAVVLFVMWMVMKGSPSKTPVVMAEVEEAPAPVYVDSTGWDSALVKLARSLHDLVVAESEGVLALLRDRPAVWDFQKNVGSVEGEEQEVRAWAELGRDEQTDFVNQVVNEMLRGLDRELLADWKPYEGWVQSETATEAVVRLRVTNRADATMTDRHVQWTFNAAGGKWLAARWERWISPEEEAAMKAQAPSKIVKRTLSDGSFVIEGKVREVEQIEEVSEEERARIDALCDQLVDLDARPRVRTNANNALVETGKTAIPSLLNKLATIPLETDEQAMQLNLVHLALTEITGYITTFKPHEALGGTLERRESGIKQWFGWYERRFKRFEERKEEEDPLMDLKPRNERERREFEKIKREREQGDG
jgi:predicted Zn finger-like uncharacterized protein